MCPQWNSVIQTTPAHFHHTALQSLIDNVRCAVSVKSFLHPALCDSITANIERRGVHWYPGFEGKQGRLGLCATEYHAKQNGRALYFSRVKEETERKRSILQNADPIASLSKLLATVQNVLEPRELDIDNALYFNGLIRAMNAASTLHYDFAPHQLPGWWISNTEVQLGAVIYLQMPADGGALAIYNLQGDMAFETFNRDRSEKGPHGFETSLVKDVAYAELRPEAGDLLLFNSRNFHQVGAIHSSLPRYSINSFISLVKGSLHIWN